MKKKLVFVFLLVAATLVPHQVRAEFMKPNLQNFVKTLVRFNALDINDDEVLDDYARVEECDLYKFLSKDQFKWHEVRSAMRDSIRNTVGTFPTSYYYNAELQLDKYDFHEKFYKFSQKTSLKNANTFTMDARRDLPCGFVPQILPDTFQFVLEQPLYIEGLPIDEREAKDLLKRMEKEGNTDHIIYVRFNMNVVFISPLRRPKDAYGRKEGTLAQTEKGMVARTIRISTRMAAVDFYEDKERTKLIYSFRP